MSDVVSRAFSALADEATALAFVVEDPPSMVRPLDDAGRMHGALYSRSCEVCGYFLCSIVGPIGETSHLCRRDGSIVSVKWS